MQEYLHSRKGGQDKATRPTALHCVVQTSLDSMTASPELGPSCEPDRVSIHIDLLHLVKSYQISSNHHITLSGEGPCPVLELSSLSILICL